MTDSDQDAIDLKALLAALRRRWAIVLGCTIVAAVVCAVQLRGTLPVYQVAMKVAAVERAAYDARRVEAVAPRSPSDAGPRPVRSHGEAAAFMLYLESLRSRNVADVLARDPEILKMLPAGQSMASRAGALLGWPARVRSPGAGVQRFLLANLQVEPDEKRHFIATVRLRSAEPKRAAHLLASLHRAADDRLRRTGLVQSRALIAQLEAMPGAQTDAATIKALGEERVVEASALSGGPFAAQLVDEPAASPDPVSNPFRTLACAIVLGLAAGIAIALLLDRVLARRAAGGRAAA